MMTKKELNFLLAQGEKITVEFKEARNALNKDVFESICAFLNRNGGHLILGVNDAGEVTGVCEQAISKIKLEAVSSSGSEESKRG